MRIDELKVCLARLPEKDRAFAQSLINQYAARGSLSEKQAYWVDRLINSINAKPTQVGSMAGVVALFETAKQHLKRPAIVLDAGVDTIRLSVAGPKAKVPGSLTITSADKRDENDRRLWYGRIKLDGTYEPSGTLADSASLVPYLQRFAEKPAEVAAEHGRLTGRCCFCNIALKDERSTAVGYGRICADHYGLPWGEAKHSFEVAA